MKLAILGTGKIVNDMLKMLPRTGMEKVCILGRKEHHEKAEKLADDYDLDEVFFDYNELLRSEYDTVYVALPNVIHFDFAKKALLAGKHVIVEKPATSNPQEFHELRALAKERHLFLFEAVDIPYLPAYITLQDDVKRLGRIHIVSLNYSQYSSRYDAFRAGTVLPAFDPVQAGGALMDLNVYNLHALYGLFGMPDDIHYTANIKRNIDTSGILTLSYGNMKATAIGAKDCGPVSGNFIEGEEGTILFESPVNRLFSYEIRYRNGKLEKKHFEEDHRLLYEFLAFRQMIESNDIARAEKMLNQSQAVSELLYKARKEVGLVFPNDPS